MTSKPVASQAESPLSKLIQHGFLAAGITNLVGMLLAITISPITIPKLYPEVFSHFGMAGIGLWGLAYISVHRSWDKTRGLIAVFAVEKLAYSTSWIYWIFHHSSQIPELYSQDPFAAIFYIGYGPTDFLFFILFVFAIFQRR